MRAAQLQPAQLQPAAPGCAPFWRRSACGAAVGAARRAPRRRCAAVAPRASAAEPPPEKRTPLAEVKNKAEAGDARRWSLELWARQKWHGTRFGIAAPGPGEPASVRWSLYESDPSLNQSLISEGTTISQLFDQDKWERHRRVDRYFRHVTPASIAGSTVFRRILSPCAALAAFAAAVCVYNLALVPIVAARLPLLAPAVLPVSLNLAPFSLVSPMVGLLLVFRANFSYARFLEGRLLWGAAVRHCRDVARLATSLLPPSEERSALLGHLQAWAWLLKAHLRAGRTRDDPNDPTSYRDDPSRDVRAALPPAHSEPLLQAQNRPYVALCACTALLRALHPSLPDYATRRIEETICDMGAVTGGCERILSTPMPLSYTRFTGRALIAWLMTLPLALWPLTGWATPLVMFALSYVTLGIDECGVEIEEPFCILPLQALCEAIRRDVGIAERAGAAGMAAWPGEVSANSKGNGNGKAAVAADAAAAV